MGLQLRPNPAVNRTLRDEAAQRLLLSTLERIDGMHTSKGGLLESSWRLRAEHEAGIVNGWELALNSLLSRLAFFGVLHTCVVLSACADPYYFSNVIQSPNYDYLVGKSFSESIFQGRKLYSKIRDIDGIEELEHRRPDRCVLVFGVRKTDDAILYWRIDSGPGSCPTRDQPLNR